MSPQKKKEDKKDKKNANKPDAVSVAAVAGVVPGFGKAKLTLLEDGNWQVDLQCINGNPDRQLIAKLPASTTFYGGERISSPSLAAVYLPDGVNVDPRYVFPWNPDEREPLRLGGGAIKGNIAEGAQRRDPKPKDPFLAPILVADWLNGARLELSEFIPAAAGLTFYPGDSAFALLIVDPITRKNTLVAVAKSEGDCLNDPAV